MEALLKRNQVLSLSKALGFVLAKLVQTNETATFDRVVVGGYEINQVFAQVVQNHTFILILEVILVQCFPDFFDQHFFLVIIEPFGVN